MGGVYEQLGLARVVNAQATVTTLGGSVMAPEVVAAMVDAAHCFVDLEELQRRAAAHIAALTRNAAAYITSGAAAGIVISTAACATGADAEAVARVPDLRGLRDEVVIQRSHRNSYDRHFLLPGTRLIEIGDAAGTRAGELEAALGPRTAAVAFLAHPVLVPPGALDLATVVGMAHARGVPVIVDAAAQLPPVENLWRYTAEGADLAVFSGGKDLGGPQSSGLIVGRPDLIAACALHGNPRAAIGRPMKVGKEEIAGLLVAVERYIGLDHAARAAAFERRVAAFIAGCAPLPGVKASRAYPNEAGQPLPRLLLTLDAATARRGRDAMVAGLRDGEPSIRVALAGADGLYINPMTLAEDDDAVVLRRVIALLA
jgi:L-seryl-tRNA(Ser) seleniumtransferase